MAAVSFDLLSLVSIVLPHRNLAHQDTEQKFYLLHRQPLNPRQPLARISNLLRRFIPVSATEHGRDWSLRIVLGPDVLWIIRRLAFE